MSLVQSPILETILENRELSDRILDQAHQIENYPDSGEIRVIEHYLS
jgi:hypothetical protein